MGKELIVNFETGIKNFIETLRKE